MRLVSTFVPTGLLVRVNSILHAPSFHPMSDRRFCFNFMADLCLNEQEWFISKVLSLNRLAQIRNEAVKTK
jgi:hypothetical protein